MDDISGKWLKMANKTADKKETLSAISEKQAVARKKLVAINNLLIEPQFEKYIRRHSEQEYKALFSSIEQEGKIREPITVKTTDVEGKFTVVDGHHRLRAAKSLLDKGRLSFNSLPVNIENFESDDEVFVWMLRNQLGRRNLSPFERAEIGFRITSFLEDLTQKKRLHQKVDNRLLSIWIKAPEDAKIDYAKIVSEITGVPRTTVIRAKKLYNNASDELKYEVRSGDISISKAYEKVVSQEKQKKQSDRLAKRKDDFSKNLFQIKEIEDILSPKLVAQVLGLRAGGLKVSVVKKDGQGLLYAVAQNSKLTYLEVIYQNLNVAVSLANYVVYIVHKGTDFTPPKNAGLISIDPTGRTKLLGKCGKAKPLSEKNELELLRSLLISKLKE